MANTSTDLSEDKQSAFSPIRNSARRLSCYTARFSRAGDYFLERAYLRSRLRNRSVSIARACDNRFITSVPARVCRALYREFRRHVVNINRATVGEGRKRAESRRGALRSCLDSDASAIWHGRTTWILASAVVAQFSRLHGRFVITALLDAPILRFVARDFE